MRLFILGAGGYGKTVADIAAQSGDYESIHFLDDNSTDEGVLGKCAEYPAFANADARFIPAFGNNRTRMAWLHRLEEDHCKIATLIHQTAYISPSATIGAGTVVLPKAMVNTNSVVQQGCIINCGAIIDHDCVIEAGTHICLGAIIKGENRIPGETKIEAGCVVENRTYPL